MLHPAEIRATLFICTIKIGTIHFRAKLNERGLYMNAPFNRIRNRFIVSNFCNGIQRRN